MLSGIVFISYLLFRQSSFEQSLQNFLGIRFRGLAPKDTHPISNRDELPHMTADPLLLTVAGSV